MPVQLDTLRNALADGGVTIFDRHHSIGLTNSSRAIDADLTGRHVLLRARTQLFSALALLELDGVAERIVIAPPDLMPEHVPYVMDRAKIDVIVSDDPALAMENADFEQLHLPLQGQSIEPSCQSEWVLFTSGTTGMPKMVIHHLSGLIGAIKPIVSPNPVWGTFYDIRRFGGLQILLRALTGRSALVLSDPDESVAEFLIRLGRHDVTHLTGTPSHWRRALMSPANGAIEPQYARLSGEIADQAILDQLRTRFPSAAIGHAYASTEAGVGFEVTDGLAGFPASYLGRQDHVEMKVSGGTLHIRSPRTASQYVDGGNLKNDGWVDTGDMVERRGDRYFFIGRTGGIINVGGLKINPEEVEAVINRQPGVRMSRVLGRKSPIMGAIVTAEVVLVDAANDNDRFRQAILEACRNSLPPFKVPAILRFVPTLALTAGGKLSRHA